MQQLTVAAEGQYVDPVFVPRNRRRCVLDTTADSLPTGPASAVPGSVLQGVVVADSEEIQPPQAPGGHRDIRFEAATQIEGGFPGRAVVGPLIEVVVGPAVKDVESELGPREMAAGAPFRFPPSRSYGLQPSPFHQM